MKSIRFELSQKDIKIIAEALGSGSYEGQQILDMFTILKGRGSSISITEVESDIPYVCVEPYIPEHFTPSIDPKVQMMGAPVSAPVGDKQVDEISEGPVHKPTPTPEPEPTPEPVKIIAEYGWDDRVPKPSGPEPTPEPVQPEPVQPAPEPKPVRPKPQPVPVHREPDFNKDNICSGCGGFTDENPHSDASMNCDCDDGNPDPPRNPEPKPVRPKPEPKPVRPKPIHDTWSTKGWTTD